jgi:uncharacterized coiled-coil DUF342 family protein
MTTPNKPGDESQLATAASALEEELRKFEQLGQLACKIELSSERNLEKAARATQEAAESQQRVAAHVARLVGAITAARDRQQAVAESIQERAGQLQARRAEMDELLQEFGALGGEANAINQLVGQVNLPKAAGAPQSEALGDVVARLQEIQDRMGHVVERAKALAEKALGKDVQDIAENAESLQKQVHASRNKLNLLLEKLSARA